MLPVLAAFIGLIAFILRFRFKKENEDTKKNRLQKMILYVVFNLLLLWALLGSLMIYTSTIEGLPWYEPCGMQFLIIFIFFAPAFLAIGAVLFILSKYYHISRLSKSLPFIAAAGLSLPLFGPLNRGISIGLPINIALCLLVVAATVMNLMHGKNSHPPQSKGAV